MEQVLMKAAGSNGTVELLEDRIRIKRGGGLLTKLLEAGGGAPPEYIIFLKDISAVNFHKPGWATIGYIRFAVGGTPALSRIRDIERDKNAICFTRRETVDFERIKEAIEKKIVSLREGGAKLSNLGELEKLAALRDKGIITEEEFQAKKKQLLGL
jgi:hypothetical protein